MAKLKAPLMSLGASQQLGKALVFFPWKGLDLVREYVVPANPQTALQTTQRGYLTAAVALVHAAQSIAANPLTQTDISAYALWASVVKAATTWFNQAVKNHVDQLVAGLSGHIYRDGTTTPAAGALGISLRYSGANGPTAGTVFYGTSKTALVLTQAAGIAAGVITANLAGLTAGVKYFWQFRPTAPAMAVGNRSGIYYGYPT